MSTGAAALPSAHPAATPITDALHDLLPGLWPSAETLTDALVGRAKRLWLDTTACACSGLRAAEPARWLAELGLADAGAVPLPGSEHTFAASAAASAFALGACWDEACEGSALAHGRPGVPIVAALWSQLGAQRPSWSALWRATVVGYEVGARLGAWLRIGRGQHVDGMWSAFGAAAALAHLRGWSWQDALRALEACAVQLPYTLYLPIAQGANVRNTYLGHSTGLALQAVQAVAAGMATPPGAIDVFAGLALPETDAPPAMPAPGHWVILDSYWKPFAGVRHVHYGAAAAQGLRPQVGDPAAIEALRLIVYPEALVYCGNRAPATPIAAQFSLSFGVAAALVFGDLSPAEYRPPRFDDVHLRRLEGLIAIEADAQAYPPPLRGARLDVRAAGGWLRNEQARVVGDPGFEPSPAEQAAKFTAYTEADPALRAWAMQVQHDDPAAPAVWPEATLTRSKT